MNVVLLSSNAFATLDEISDFSLKPLRYDLVERYLSLIEDAKSQIEKFQHLGIPFNKNICKIVLHKNTSFYYKYDINSQTITILLFIDNRANPKDHFKLL